VVARSPLPQLANRLRERLGDQRQAAQLLKRREKAIEARLATLRESG
jgi:CHASE3 domain sensor protein